MPSTEQHLRQVQSNREALEQTVKPDWRVTIRFYEAVHLIEAVLARQGIHTSNHGERADQVAERRLGFTTGVRHAYSKLTDAAHTARYLCPSQGTLERLDEVTAEHLEDVRAAVITLLGPS